MHSAGGILIKDGKILLIHWDPPRSSYDFPKGRVRLFEPAALACKREVFEETGYKTGVVAYLGSNEYDLEVRGKHYHKTVDYFLLELTDDTAYPPRREKHETFENEWVALDKAEALITRDINKDIFRRALEWYTN